MRSQQSKPVQGVTLASGFEMDNEEDCKKIFTWPSSSWMQPDTFLLAIQKGINDWNEDVIFFPLDKNIKTLLGNVVLTPSDWNDDVKIWVRDPSGEVTIKSAYCVLHESKEELPNNAWPWIQKLPTIPKNQFQFWWMLHDMLPTEVNMDKRGI